MRIVIDTAVFIAAVRSGSGPAREVLRMVFRGDIVPLMDYRLGMEYREVASRPQHVGASELNEGEMLELIEALEAFAEPVKVVSQPRPLSPDPDDDMILDIAINGHAEALVTGNVRHFATAAQHFQIPVISPADLLRRMKGKVTHDK